MRPAVLLPPEGESVPRCYHLLSGWGVSVPGPMFLMAVSLGGLCPGGLCERGQRSPPAATEAGWNVFLFGVENSLDAKFNDSRCTVFYYKNYDD